MNKKFLIAIIIVGVILTVVEAGLMLYYAQITADIEVIQPITVTGDLSYTFDAMAGETVGTGENVLIQNDANFPITITVSNDAPDGINVVYEYEYEPNLFYNILLEGETITLSGKYENATSQNWVRLYVSYELDSMLETGTYTVTTTIDQVE
ncbi:hypothetical protein KAI04_03505 [Candidatus Pacearchaeota archaeon]|nr:hypothetical protein [Candidatus Pacearchaeota archaeon]